MKKKILKNNLLFIIVNTLILVIAASLLVYELIIADELHFRGIIVGSALVCISLFNYGRLRYKKTLSQGSFTKCEDGYKKYIEGAFQNSKKDYNKLIKLTMLYNQGQHNKLHRQAKKLLKKCTVGKDYGIVCFFEALAYTEAGEMDMALATYKKVLQYDMTNTFAWSNMGWIYLEQKRLDEAYEAFANGIRFDSKDAYAYGNMAHYYLEIKEPELALEYAEKAFQINANIKEVIQAAAIACKMLGDEEKMQKYIKMYALNGGNAYVLEKYMDEEVEECSTMDY